MHACSTRATLCEGGMRLPMYCTALSRSRVARMVKWVPAAGESGTDDEQALEEMAVGC